MSFIIDFHVREESQTAQKFYFNNTCKNGIVSVARMMQNDQNEKEAFSLQLTANMQDKPNFQFLKHRIMYLRVLPKMNMEEYNLEKNRTPT